jgi:hypothetical protein
MKTKLGFGFLLVLAFLFSLFAESNLHVHAASYSPYDVDESKIDNAIKGNRSASFTSGKKLVYDVYDDLNGKEGWTVSNRDYGNGKQPYLEFEGWAALVGYTHHDKNNQDTFLYFTNTSGGKRETKIYKAEPKNYDASKDIEYNRKSMTGDITNPAPKGTYNVNNSTYNLYYKNVGFKAHIPLHDLFENDDKNSTWSVQIVKRVENKYVYDDLKLPFDFNGLQYQNGDLQLTSGVDADNLIMNDTGVARRTEPRGTGYSGGKYFSRNDTYKVVKSDQQSTVIWYGVKTPEESNKTRWAASLYWNLGGQRAVLNYTVASSTITIRHVDKATGKELDVNKQSKAVGSKWSFHAREKGYFKDENGADYVPLTSPKTGTMPRNGTTITFEYEIPDSDITVRHVDKQTGDLLETETISQKVGTKYTVKPKADGHYRDKNDAPYVSVSKEETGRVPEDGIVITMEYQVPEVDIKVNHIDEDTGESLKTEVISQKIGTDYSIDPEAKGVFKDKNGADYVPLSTTAKGKVPATGVTITFKYRIPESTITVLHQDYDTGKVLQKETLKQKVGTNYNISPKARATFKGSDGNPYVPVDQPVNGKLGEQGKTITFKYRLSLPYPDTGGTVKGATDGDAALSGDVNWKLYQDSKTAATKVRTENAIDISGVHFETRNIKKDILVAGKLNSRDNDNLLVVTGLDSKAIEGTKVTYTLKYEYTNSFKDVYKPKEFLGDDVFVWEKTGEKADWNKVKTTDKKFVLDADYKLNEDITFEEGKKANLSFKIGQYMNLKGESKFDWEYISSNNELKETNLKTQSWTGFLPEDFYPSYSVSKESAKTSETDQVAANIDQFGVKATYYPVDIDENLKGRYVNETDYNYSDIAIPLELITMNQGTHNQPFTFKALDNYYLTEKQGFVAAVQGSNENQVSLQYKDFTGERYEDQITSINHGLSKEDLKKTGGGYYLPVAADSKLKAGEEYTDYLVIQDIGLSNTTIVVPKKYSFDNYLLGAAVDEPVVIEQNETPVKLESYPNSLTISSEMKYKIASEYKDMNNKLLHGFSALDGADLYKSLKDNGLLH